MGENTEQISNVPLLLLPGASGEMPASVSLPEPSAALG